MVPMHLLNLAKTELDEPICQIVQLLLSLHTVSAFCHSFHRQQALSCQSPPSIGSLAKSPNVAGQWLVDRFWASGIVAGRSLLGFQNCGLQLKHTSKIFGATIAKSLFFLYQKVCLFSNSRATHITVHVHMFKLPVLVYTYVPTSQYVVLPQC